jgi:predicted acyltransferase
MTGDLTAQRSAKPVENSMATTVEKPVIKQERIVALDVLRGIVISFMILVNNNGSEHFAYTQLRHAAWNGWTLTDLVFPSFLFMVGLTTIFSTESRLSKGAARQELFLHTLKRAAMLFCFGLIVNGFPYFPLATWRIYGVLPRIALCYLVVSVLYLFSRRALTFIVASALCLIGYYLLMRWVPVPGYGLPTRDVSLLDPNGNWVAYVDRLIFPHRLYEKVRDPEGLISTIPAIATACLGVLTGLWLRSTRTAKEKATGLLVAAILGLVFGEVWNLWFPINKKLWTSSYVLFAAGCTLLLLFVCYLLLDVKKWRGKWTWPWLVFGSNAITAYMFSELFAEVLHSIYIPYAGSMMSVKECIYESFFKHLVNPSLGSLLYSLAFVAVCFIPNVFLYRRKIFLKV